MNMTHGLLTATQRKRAVGGDRGFVLADFVGTLEAYPCDSKDARDDAGNN
jgi:hypothetical protein